MEDLEAVVGGHLFWQTILKENLWRKDTTTVLTFIVPTWKLFVFQNFANLEETVHVTVVKGLDCKTKSKISLS